MYWASSVRLHLDWLENDNLRNLIIVIYGVDSQKVLERWSFAVETDQEVSASNGAMYQIAFCRLNIRSREKDISVIQREIQAIIRQITASMTFLPLLDELCINDIAF